MLYSCMHMAAVAVKGLTHHTAYRVGMLPLNAEDASAYSQRMLDT